MTRRTERAAMLMRRAGLATLAVGLLLSACERAAPPGERVGGGGHGHGAGHVAGAESDAMAGPRVSGAAAEVVEVVNRYCPLLVGQSVGAEKRCERVMTRSHKGRLVGFCDAECVKAWDQMSEERRGQVLAEALALEAQAPPASPSGMGGAGGTRGTGD